MTEAKISKLERVDLRQVWKHEAYDFTRWLQENIDVLNDATDLTLVNVEREKSAGSFSIDLVAEDESGDKVIIERACRIRASVPGGYRSPESEWPSIQTALVNAMTRLEAAL